MIRNTFTNTGGSEKKNRRWSRIMNTNNIEEESKKRVKLIHSVHGVNKTPNLRSGNWRKWNETSTTALIFFMFLLLIYLLAGLAHRWLTLNCVKYVNNTHTNTHTRTQAHSIQLFYLFYYYHLLPSFHIARSYRESIQSEMQYHYSVAIFHIIQQVAAHRLSSHWFTINSSCFGRNSRR